jgi:hypothetical protein
LVWLFSIFTTNKIQHFWLRSNSETSILPMDSLRQDTSSHEGTYP